MSVTTVGYVDVEMNEVDKGVNHSSSHPALITSRQPTFPQEYASREGNASMVAILGFVMAVLTSSLLDVFSPHAAQSSIWLYLMCFGGLLQLYAGIKDFNHGNTLAACIFLLFGFHWISHGVLMGDLMFLQNVGPTAGEKPKNEVMGCYYLSFTIFELMLTVCSYLNPQGSWLLVIILIVVQLKLILNTIDAFAPHIEIAQASGCLGILVCLLALYSFFAESLAEHGDIIPTGKFAGVKSRSEVKKELHDTHNKKQR